MIKSILYTLLAIATVECAITRDNDIGIKNIYRVYDECSRSHFGTMPCLKKKAILFLDRASRMDNIPLLDGVNVVKSSDADIKPISEIDIDENISRSLNDKDATLTDMLAERVAAFANTRTIQLSLPKMSAGDLEKGVEEGRGKMKKMMSMMAMGFAMKMAAMVPIAIAGLFILAGKALIVSKIALLLSGIIALKKLLAQKNSGGHETSHGWSSSGGGGSTGGWDKRSINDIPYSAYRS